MKTEVAKIEIKESDLQLIVSNKVLGELTTNAKQIKALVENSLPNYDIKNYSEDNIEFAKKDKAMLNNSAKVLNAKRIEIEKEFMNPFSEFKEIVNETVKLMSECSAKIDIVVKQSDQKAKDNKRALIEKYWTEKEFTLIPFTKVFEDKWLNKGSKEKDIHTEIDTKISKVKDDMLTLEAIGEDVELLKSIYIDTLNINSTIQYANTLKQNREKVKVEAEKQPINVIVAEPTPVKEIEPIPEVFKTEVQTVIPTQSDFTPHIPPIEKEELLTRALKVVGTKDDIIAISEFLNGRGIYFERIELYEKA